MKRVKETFPILTQKTASVPRHQDFLRNVFRCVVLQFRILEVSTNGRKLYLWQLFPIELNSYFQRVFGGGNHDRLLETKGLHEGRGYIEPRVYTGKGATINYVFTSKIFHQQMEDWLRTYPEKNGGHGLDLIIVNSCLWDVNRCDFLSWSAQIIIIEMTNSFC